MTGMSDAGFLYMETPAMHMHTLKMAIVEPSSDMTFDNLVEQMTFRLRRMPRCGARSCRCPSRSTIRCW